MMAKQAVGDNRKFVRDMAFFNTVFSWIEVFDQDGHYQVHERVFSPFSPFHAVFISQRLLHLCRDLLLIRS